GRQGGKLPARAPGEQPVGHAEGGGSLGEDRGDPAGDGGGPDGARDVPAATQDGVEGGDEPAGPDVGASGEPHCASGSQGITAVEAGDLERMERVARRGNQLGLGALASRELDLSALAAKLAGYRERR